MDPIAYNPALPPWGPAAGVDFQHVSVSLGDRVQVHIPHLLADFYQVTPPALPDLGKSNTFLAHLRSGEVVVSVPQIEAAIRRELKAAGSAVSNFGLRTQVGNRVELQLTYTWGPFTIPVNFKGTVQISTDHQLLFKPATIDAGFYTFLLPVVRGLINDTLRPLGIRLGEDWAVLDPVRLLGMLGNSNLAGLENLNFVTAGNGYLALGVGLGKPIYEAGYWPGNNHLKLRGAGAAIGGIVLYGFDLTGRDPKRPDLVIGQAGAMDGMSIQFNRVQGLGISDREMATLIGRGEGAPLDNMAIYTQPGLLWIGGTMKGTRVTLSGPTSVTPDGKLLLAPLALTYGPLRLNGRLGALLAARLTEGLEVVGNGLAFDLNKILGIKLPPLAQVIPDQGRLYLKFAGDGLVPPPAAKGN